MQNHAKDYPSLLSCSVPHFFTSASKSIRPVDRSDFEVTRNERKFSGIKKANEELTHLVFRNSSEFSTTYGFDFPRE